VLNIVKWVKTNLLIMNNELSFDLTKSMDIKQNFSLKFQGSEAKVYEGKFLNQDAILKERFLKKYRHPDLDKTLTTERMRAEARALNKCIDIGIKCPAIYFADLQTRYLILQKIQNAITVKEILKSKFIEDGISSVTSLLPLAQKIGVDIAKMHKNELVHGDLTTSNILLKEGDISKISSNLEFDVYFIDFGLSKRDVTVEDKAVDLYVLERAISSSHPNSQNFFDNIIESYLRTVGEQAAVISDKLEEVRQRGRKRSMVG